MEPQQHQIQNQQQQLNEDSSSSGKGSFLCRQSSTRWTPTTDQIRILKDLYYNNGVRSPSAEQIQRISARLRQYGKIEGKNVFYWFQNHKARERQKKKYTPTDVASMQRTASSAAANGGWNKADDHNSLIQNKHYSNLTPGYPASPSTAGVITVAQAGNYGYGSVTMDKSFRDCSISASGSSAMSGSRSHNFGWVGIDPYYSSYAIFDTKKQIDETLEEEHEDEEEEAASQIETLPLFPMHGEDINGFCNIKADPDNSCYSGWYMSDDGNSGPRASLELSLNSYTGRSQY